MDGAQLLGTIYIAQIGRHAGEATAIAERLNALTDEKAEYYDLNGRRIDGLRKGVNIVRRNGTTTKVTIK